MKTLVSENIGKILFIKKMTQSDLAEAASVSRVTINSLISTISESNPKLSTIIKISKALNTDFPQLFTRNVDSQKTFDDEMNLSRYLNIFIQNIQLKIRGKSQSSLSTEPGVHESTISEILSGKIEDPTLSTIAAISFSLEIPLDQMFKRGGDSLDL